jgi:phage baseplate assembly protein W
MQRVLNCRAGTLAHLPDYGLPDMTKILQGMPGTAHELMGTLSAVLLKYEPRLKRIDVVLLEQNVPGELRYAIDAELKGIGLCATAPSLCRKGGFSCGILSNSNISIRKLVCKARKHHVSKITVPQKLQARQPVPVSFTSKTQADIAAFRQRMAQLQEQMDAWLTGTGLNMERSLHRSRTCWWRALLTFPVSSCITTTGL